MSPTTHVTERTAPARRTDSVHEVEAERAALVRLLHDDVMQSLIAARYAADLSGNTAVVEAVREALAEARAAMWRLRPRTSDGHLVRALADLAEWRTDVVLAVRADGVPDVIDADAATVAYRVVQAALDACDATTADVRVALVAGVLTVSICADGPAYDAAVHAPDTELPRWRARPG